MSITFALARRTPEGTTFACDADHGICVVPEHLLDEDIALYSMPGWCVECSDTNRDACEICGLDLNMSNTNAQVLLGMLGVEFDYCGMIDPADLLGRVLADGSLVDDSGVPDSVYAGDHPVFGGATVVECGLPAGYFASRFGALADLATVAMQRGLVISWG